MERRFDASPTVHHFPEIHITLQSKYLFVLPMLNISVKRQTSSRLKINVQVWFFFWFFLTLGRSPFVQEFLEVVPQCTVSAKSDPPVLLCMLQ